MTQIQATEFASEWKVVEQYDGAIEVEFGQLLSFSIPTGLSVTLFENSDGQQVVAIRGTEAWDPLDPLDIVTDVVDIAVLGSSQYQLQYEALSDKIEEWLDNGTLQSGFTVTGHSLGGFLATNPRRSSISDCGYSPVFNKSNPVSGNMPDLILS